MSETTHQDTDELSVAYHDLFKNMLEGLAYCEMIYDANGKPIDYLHIDVNDAFEKLTGIKEVIGKKITEIIPDILTTNPELFEVYGRVAETGESVTFETFVGGLSAWYSISVYSPKKKFFVVAFENITERKKTEDDLKQSQSRLTITIESIGDALIVFNKDLKVERMNKRAESIVHWPKDDAVGKDCDEVFSFENFNFNGKRLKDLLIQVLETKSVIEVPRAKFTCVDCRPLCHDDPIKEKTIEDSISPILDESGQIRGAVVVFRDITQRVEAEENSKKLEQQLYQSQKMEALGQFSGGIAHDFNNILTVINGYADFLLADIKTEDPMYKGLSEIKLAGIKAADMTKKILAFSRRQVIERKSVDVNQVAQHFLIILNRLVNEDISIMTSFNSTRMIEADPGQVERILLNLVSNAKDAINAKSSRASEKKILIETSDFEVENEELFENFSLKEGAYILIKVSDTGAGMSKDVLDKLFEPFFTTKPQGQGTGLGLSSVYGILKQNDAAIDVVSEVGVGTIFKIYWPVLESKSVEATIEEEIEENSIDLSHANILFVEDNESLRGLVENYFKKMSWEIQLAQNGAEALQLFDMNKVHLVVTDVIMPEMDGEEFVRRAIKINPRLKVIYTSGYTANYIAKNGILKNGVNFLAKPFQIKDLIAKIDEVLKKNGTSHA